MSLPARTTAAWALLLGALAGCGSDGSGSDRPAAASSPSASSPSYDPQQQRKDDAAANLTDFFSVYAPMGEDYFTRPEAECIAGRVVEEPGIRRLQRAGVLNDELQYVIDADPTFSRADARAVTAAVFGCSDAEDVLRRQTVADLDVTPAQKDCAAERLTDELLTFLFALSLQDKPLDLATQRMAEAFAPCRDA